MRLKKAKYRRPFLLLETLIAVAMIGICSTYLISTPIKVYQNHLEDLKKIELSRIAENLFTHIQYQLKKNHPWNTLKEDSETIYPLEMISLNIHPIFNMTYQCGYTLRIKKTKEGQGDTTYRLLECVVYITPSRSLCSWDKIPSSAIFKYSYLILVSGAPARKVI